MGAKVEVLTGGLKKDSRRDRNILDHSRFRHGRRWLLRRDASGEKRRKTRLRSVKREVPSRRRSEPWDSWQTSWSPAVLVSFLHSGDCAIGNVWCGFKIFTESCSAVIYLAEPRDARHGSSWQSTPTECTPGCQTSSMTASQQAFQSSAISLSRTLASRRRFLWLC